MKRNALLSLLVLLILLTTTAFGAEVEYTGRVSKDMTIRKERSRSAAKLGNVWKDEIVEILEYGESWTRVQKDGVTGYILTQNVTDLVSCEPYDDAAQTQFTAVTGKTLTLRQEKHKNAPAAQTIPEGETIYVLSLGKEWAEVSRNGVVGFVLAGGLKSIEPLKEGVQIPEELRPAPEFVANYTAQADVNLSIRKEKRADSALVGTVYDRETVEVMETDGDWALVRKGRAQGYVRGSHLRYYTRLDAYGPLVPGTVCYPYAAATLEETEIYDAETDELLRTVPAGCVLAVSALDSSMSVTLPYDRITGRILATGNLELEAAVPWDEAQNGDLLAVFNTYYDPEKATQTQIGRMHNINEGIRRLDDVVIPAGERFSFNDHCAPYSQKNGYELGPIINYTSSQNLGYGGGICQVSTTLYNAVLQIPIYVAKWQVHSSYGISYAPLDFDSAVGMGNIDLRLDNTLPYAVRLHLEAQGGVLTVRIYRCE